MVAIRNDGAEPSLEPVDRGLLPPACELPAGGLGIAGALFFLFTTPAQLEGRRCTQRGVNRNSRISIPSSHAADVSSAPGH